MPFEPLYLETFEEFQSYRARTPYAHIGTFYLHAGKLYIGGYVAADFFGNEAWYCFRGMKDMAEIIERICRNNKDFISFAVETKRKRIHIFADVWRISQLRMDRMYRTRSGSMNWINYKIPCEKGLF